MSAYPSLNATAIDNATIFMHYPDSKTILYYASIGSLMLLFKSVKEGKSALSTLASDWLEVYVSDNGVGLTELVKFVIQSCGCNAPLSHAVLTSERGIVQAIQELTQGFDEESGEYPLIMNGPLYKRYILCCCCCCCVLFLNPPRITTILHCLDSETTFLSSLSASSHAANRVLSMTSCFFRDSWSGWLD